MVDIGAGYSFRRHWKNMDYPTSHYVFLSGVVDYKFNLSSKKLFPFKSDSVNFFYSSHTFEHILQPYIPFIFKEIFRCLKPNGAVRITMPDFKLACNAFKENNIDFYMNK